MTEDLIKKCGSCNSKYSRYAGRERVQNFTFCYHQTGTCKICKCDNEMSDKKHLEN